VVLGGANGSGKTTASRSVLAEVLGVMTFVNADVIAQGLSGFDPASAAVEASRVMLERLHKLAAKRESFAFETTLAARSYVSFLERLKADGYLVHLYYFWLDNPDLNVMRVAQRVCDGGHSIPESTIRQRYGRSVKNFLTLYRPIPDRWQVYDNSLREGLELLAEAEGGAVRIVNDTRWQLFLRCAENE
jgi:predicted ABC-type ATPase